MYLFKNTQDSLWTNIMIYAYIFMNQKKKVHMISNLKV